MHLYLLYLDESGPTDRGHFVVAGLLVDARDVDHLINAVELLVSRLPDPLQGAELHAGPIRKGARAWRHMTRQARGELIASLVDLLTRGAPGASRAPVLFAVAIHRASFTHNEIDERAYEAFFTRPNSFLSRLSAAGERHRCIAISDKSTLETKLQQLMNSWKGPSRSAGTASRRMEAYLEVPFFVDSGASRLVQLADFIAHWVYRAYEHGDTSVLDQLLPAFDTEGATIHGLVHLTRDHRACDCAACASRRR